ncbi:MAG: cobalamin-binding protein [Halioglobus sp.]|nr:cobalamin-binding protein [Halioglobus sp.]
MKYLAAMLLLLALAARAQPVTVRDFAGRDVTLPRPAQRIVALAPHIVENLFSAGAGGQIVGVVDYSDFPARAQRLPRVGSYNTYSLEQVAALQPDLVAVWGSGNGEATLRQLENLGIPVYVSELRGLADISRSIRLLGQLAGTGAVAEREASRIERELAELRRRYAAQPAVEVFYQIWDRPLQTVGGAHLISEVIALCGSHNIFSDTVGLAPQISVESVLQRNPQAIVASGAGDTRPAWLEQWRDYPFLAAVSGAALFHINPDHIQRPTARILLGARALCTRLEQVRPPAASK